MLVGKVIDAEHIEDYLLGSMDDGEASRFEDELFDAAAEAAPTVASLLALMDGARRLHAAETTLGLTSSAHAIAAFEARGGHVQRYELAEGARVGERIAPDADLLVARLPIALREVDRVDLEILEEDGAPRGHRAERVEVDRERDVVWIPCQPSVARASRVTVFRLHAHRGDGSVTQHDYTVFNLE